MEGGCFLLTNEFVFQGVNIVFLAGGGGVPFGEGCICPLFCCFFAAMAITLTQKQVAFAILKWLKKQGSDEELEAAVQCLSQHFQVKLDDAECKNACDVGLDLEQAVHAIVAKSGDSDAVKEQKLQEFIGILKQKGYFQGVEEGSPAYFERYEKAKQKFNSRSNPYEGLSAEQLKTHGNQKMVSGQYQEAVNYYTKAIELDSKSAIYYANRAAAYTHLKEYQKAIADCEASLKIDSFQALLHFGGSFGIFPSAIFFSVFQAAKIPFLLFWCAFVKPPGPEWLQGLFVRRVRQAGQFPPLILFPFMPLQVCNMCDGAFS